MRERAKNALGTATAKPLRNAISVAVTTGHETKALRLVPRLHWSRTRAAPKRRIQLAVWEFQWKYIQV